LNRIRNPRIAGRSSLSPFGAALAATQQLSGGRHVPNINAINARIGQPGNEVDNKIRDLENDTISTAEFKAF
jgi:hypothetical protein